MTINCIYICLMTALWISCTHVYRYNIFSIIYNRSNITVWTVMVHGHQMHIIQLSVMAQQVFTHFAATNVLRYQQFIKWKRNFYIYIYIYVLMRKHNCANDWALADVMYCVLVSPMVWSEAIFHNLLHRKHSIMYIKMLSIMCHCYIEIEASFRITA